MPGFINKEQSGASFAYFLNTSLSLFLCQMSKFEQLSMAAVKKVIVFLIPLGLFHFTSHFV